MDSFRTDWSQERRSGKRSDFHTEQLIHRNKTVEEVEQEEDWFFNVPVKNKGQEEPEAV